MSWGPREYADTAKKLVAQFNQQRADVKCVYESLPWSRWPQVFVSAIDAGAAPDLSTGGAYQPVQYYDQGSVLEIDDVVARCGYRRNLLN